MISSTSTVLAHNLSVDGRRVSGEYASCIRQEGIGNRKYMKKEHAVEKVALINQIGQLTVDVNWFKKTTTGLRTAEKKTLIDYGSQKLSNYQCELLDLNP
jgi:hypothetical protein